MIKKEKTFAAAADKAGMDEKTARKYRRLGKLPSELKKPRSWRTRKDPFTDIWHEIQQKLEINPGLEAKTLFSYLQRQYRGKFSDGQLRTFQRRVKTWRATEGPPKEVFFPQVHRPGELSQSDFTHMNKLGVRVEGQPFHHLIYHFVLTYSNWETGMICFSESFESLSEGLQAALWELGGVPKAHQTDRLSTAVHRTDNPEKFTRRYKALLKHYKLEGRRIQPASPHENGDIEQRHFRFKKALDQELMLRGSRNFPDLGEYQLFLKKLFSELNAGRKDRLLEEKAVLRYLPNRKLDACKKLQVGVSKHSTIRVNHNVYSVDSRLIRESVDVRLYANHLEIWYGQKRVDTIPRLRGSKKHRIQYRHVIDWLVRKPGAFENYRYREDLFPTIRFRMAYDFLRRRHTQGQANKEYLHILYLAAKESEIAVGETLRLLFEREQVICAETVTEIVRADQQPENITDVIVLPVELLSYDELLDRRRYIS